MIHRAVFLVLLNFVLLKTIDSHETNTEHHPVDLLDLKNVIITNYNGPMHIETMKLLHNVESLEIKNSNLTPAAHDLLHPLKNLKKFVMANVHLEEVDKDISTCCEKLRDFEIVNLGLVKVPMHKIGTWPLERLVIRKENIPKLEKNSLTSPNLKHLKLTDCHIGSIEEGAFSKVETLEELNLERNDIKTITKEILAPLKNVKCIDLRNNKLEKLTTDMFPSLPNLEHLDVGHNPIKEINLQGLKALAPKLTKVDISGIEVDISKSGGIDFVKTDTQ